MNYRIELQQISGPHPCAIHGLERSATIEFWIGPNGYLLCEECGRRIYHIWTAQVATGPSALSSAPEPAS